MEGILHFFDFNHASTSRKLWPHKRHGDGLEAPRNSLELPIETSQNYPGVPDNIPYSYQVRPTSAKRNLHANGTPIKKLIDDEMLKETDGKRNTPSVVARLMGMDALPSDLKPVAHAKVGVSEHAKSIAPGREPTGNSIITDYSPLRPIPIQKSSTSTKLSKPRPREHPQEELLQKFKREFEAWQASRFSELSNQAIAQENLNKEKMVRYVDAKKDLVLKKPREQDYTSTSTSGLSSEHYGDTSSRGYLSKQYQLNRKKPLTPSNRTRTRDFELLPPMIWNEKSGRLSSPTRIVILRPSSEGNEDNQGPWGGSAETVKEEGSIEDFLEEVKEKLRSEIQGKDRNGVMLKGNAVDDSFRQRTTAPKVIARQIAKQIRENVTRDLGMNLMRSESTRSYRNEVEYNGPGSCEFISRDTRKFLSERMRNVPREETDGRETSVFEQDRLKSRLTTDASETGRDLGCWDGVQDEYGTKTKSFRHEQKNDEVFNPMDTSPRNLVRSLSAPVSGMAFGKLLLEDPQVLRGVIRRKHEATESNSGERRKPRKDVFNIKGRVSSLRHNFTLKGKLFRKKNQSAEAGADEYESKKFSMEAPSALMNHGATKENPTEVPPSPASLGSSSPEEFWRPADHPSPVSPLDITLIEGHSTSQVPKDISCNLSVLDTLDPLSIDGFEEANVNEKKHDNEAETVDLECQSQTYIRDVLIAAGLYELSSKCTISSWDSVTKPIPNWVFDRVEESYRESGKTDDGILVSSDDINVGHRVLFDLLNEALTNLRRPTMPSYAFKRCFPIHVTMPCGKRLLDTLWRVIETYKHPLINGSPSLDSLMASDMRMDCWLNLGSDDSDVLAMDLEWMIFEDLIDEAVKDVSC
ncbi:hypothetical protein QJS10_CPB15g00226 [Acorus calamus]|uniref:DUF4378 domain-containing protein n=1 Tax=Acorus calamus TaxID=4465 RepID=A0AAV9D4D1_ACOCL|nr:hypothetical protein QJS10_CPB15g00226 [Acorus calamus]